MPWHLKNGVRKILTLGRLCLRGIFKALITLLFLSFVRVCYIVYKLRKATLQTRLPILPHSTPVFGIAPYVLRNWRRIYDVRNGWYADLSRVYQRPVKTFAVSPPVWCPAAVIATKDPIVVKHVLKDNVENWVKGKQLREALDDFVGKGLFVLNHGVSALS